MCRLSLPFFFVLYIDLSRSISITISDILYISIYQVLSNCISTPQLLSQSIRNVDVSLQLSPIRFSVRARRGIHLVPVLPRHDVTPMPDWPHMGQRRIRSNVDPRCGGVRGDTVPVPSATPGHLPIAE